MLCMHLKSPAQQQYTSGLPRETYGSLCLMLPSHCCSFTIRYCWVHQTKQIPSCAIVVTSPSCPVLWHIPLLTLSVALFFPCWQQKGRHVRLNKNRGCPRKRDTSSLLTQWKEVLSHGNVNVLLAVFGHHSSLFWPIIVLKCWIWLDTGTEQAIRMTSLPPTGEKILCIFYELKNQEKHLYSWHSGCGLSFSWKHSESWEAFRLL